MLSELPAAHNANELVVAEGVAAEAVDEQAARGEAPNFQGRAFDLL